MGGTGRRWPTTAKAADGYAIKNSRAVVCALTALPPEAFPVPVPLLHADR
jgi:hypothetical protein